MGAQVSRSHYKFLRYSHQKRWNSYWHQLRLIFETNSKSVLEVGPGTKLVKEMVEFENVKYYSVDVADDLNPDYISDLRDMDLGKKFDITVACQVLEHMPYKDFRKNLINLKKHSNRYCIISLPYFGPFIRLHFTLYPFFDFYKVLKIPYPKEIKFDGEHYWEIGRKNYPLSRIKNDIKKEFKIKESFLCKEHPYHYFFLLEKRK